MFVYINIDTSTIPDYAKSLQSCPTLCDPMDYSLPGSSIHGASPGKNTRVGYHTLLQGIFPTQGSNPGFPQISNPGFLQADSVPSEPPGKPIHVLLAFNPFD